MGNRLNSIRVRDMPDEDILSEIELYGIRILFRYQKTGYGYKRFFVCPSCGQRRATLYELGGDLFCRSCLPLDIYSYRRNLYDEGGTGLITWHMYRLMASIGITRIKWPFNYSDYALSKPRYMRWDKFSITLKKVQMLENMRFCALFAGKRFTAADIHRYTDRDFLDRHESWEIYAYMIFADWGDCMKHLRSG